MCSVFGDKIKKEDNEGTNLILHYSYITLTFPITCVDVDGNDGDPSSSAEGNESNTASKSGKIGIITVYVIYSIVCIGIYYKINTSNICVFNY
jgi:hypothetical protein